MTEANDRPRLTPRTILQFSLMAVVYLLFFKVFYNWFRLGTVWPYRDVPDLLDDLWLNLVPIFALTVMNTLIVFFVKLPVKTEAKMVIDVVLSFALLVVTNECYKTFTGLSVDYPGTVFGNILLLLGIESIYYIQRFKAVTLRESEAREEALRYQYDALKAQVNPHFLFNSLNILYSLVTIHSPKSKDFILSLSGMYRYIMQQEKRDLIPLTDELEFLDSYVEVLRMRYHNQFEVCITGRDNVGEQACVVPYTLQLLVENVTKHNVISTRYPMHLSIDITPTELCVANPLRPREVQQSSRIGLHYLTTLYAAQGRELRIERTAGAFIVHVPLIVDG